MESLQKPKKQSYFVISAAKRIGIAFCDFLIVSLLCVSVSFLFFINSNFTIADMFTSVKTLGTKTPDAWRLFGISVVSFIIYNLYFLIIPLFNKGKTLFKHLLKARIITLKNQKSKKTLAKALFMHNLLIWFLFLCIAMLTTSFCFIFENDPVQYVQFVQAAVSLQMPQNVTNTTIEILAVLTKSLFSIAGLVSAILFIQLCMNSKKRTLHDQLAKVVVLDLNQIDNIKKQNDQPINKLTKHDNIQNILDELKDLK